MVNKHKVGMAVGSFVGFLHLAWSVLVALNLAQPLMGLVLRLHFVEMAHTVVPFQLGTAVALVILTSIIGYLVGFVFSAFLNWAHKGSQA